jgi:hypothetical protein
VAGDICSICCGTEREVTVSCPLDCRYLQDARKHDPLPDVDPRQFPNSDIKVDEAFLRRVEPLLILLASAIAAGAIEERAFDNDVKEALDALVRSWRTLESGLVYDVRPDNLIASRIVARVRESVSNVRQRLAEQGESLRDSDLLRVLVFLQRMEIQHNNGRPKGRAFIHFLTGFFDPSRASQGPASSSLIITP